MKNPALPISLNVFMQAVSLYKQTLPNSPSAKNLDVYQMVEQSPVYSWSACSQLAWSNDNSTEI